MRQVGWTSFEDFVLVRNKSCSARSKCRLISVRDAGVLLQGCLLRITGNFNTNTDRVWTELANLNEPCGWAPSVSIDGVIYVLGGAKGWHGSTLNSIEMLDTKDEDTKWQKISDIPGDSRGWCVAASVEGKIFFSV